MDHEGKGFMAETSLPPVTRLDRGVILGEERFAEITRTAPWTWSVPSCSEDHSYTVDLRQGVCGCPDQVSENGYCKHLYAAHYKKAKTALCSGCATRHRHPDLYPV